MQIQASEFFEKIEHLFHKYEERFSTFAFAFGFLLDNLTLTRIDLWIDMLILFIHLATAGVGIFLSNMRIRGTTSRRISLWAPFIMQFAFGNLFSSFVVFYSRGAAISSTWPFLLFLVCMFVGNEYFRKQYQRFGFQMSILFVVIFSFSIFYVPMVVNHIGAWVFLLSGCISLVIVGCVLALFAKLIPHRVRASRHVLVRSIPAIFIAINIMYFTNVIPPLPLSLMSAGVFHNVERTENGMYSVLYEGQAWYETLKWYTAYHHNGGDRVYVYSAIFAPTGLGTKILHHWQYYDTVSGVWKTADKLEFPIYGGRSNGYRGYSFKTNITSGLWRVDVITERGQILGRVKFEVISGAFTKQLRSGVL